MNIPDPSDARAGVWRVAVGKLNPSHDTSSVAEVRSRSLGAKFLKISAGLVWHSAH